MSQIDVHTEYFNIRKRSFIMKLATRNNAPETSTFKSLEELGIETVSTGHEGRSVIPQLPRKYYMNKNLLPTIPINRDERRRIKKMSKILKKWIPTHDEIAIFKVTKAFSYIFDDGRTIEIKPGYYLGNGNTRREFYGEYPDDAPTTNLIATVYEIDSQEKFDSHFDSYDSQDSVMNGAQYIQGAIRLLGMNVSSTLAKNGAFRSALDIAHPDPKAKILDKVCFFKNEIELLDRVGIFSHMDKQLKFQAMYAMCLIAAKYWSSPSDQYDRMVAGLQNLVSARSDELNMSGDRWDGLTCIQVQYFFETTKSWVEQGYLRKTSFATVTPQLDFLLYCFELYMTKQKIDKQKGFNSRPQDDHYDTIMDQLSKLDQL